MFAPEAVAVPDGSWDPWAGVAGGVVVFFGVEAEVGEAFFEL